MRVIVSLCVFNNNVLESVISLEEFCAYYYRFKDNLIVLWRLFYTFLIVQEVNLQFSCHKEILIRIIVKL